MSKNDQYINSIIFSKYLITKKIGKGSFGVVYQANTIQTNEKVAVKMEVRDKDNFNNDLLELEAYRLIYLQGEGVPKIHCYGNNQNHNILVMELLNKSLEDLFEKSGKKFSLKTVCSIGLEIMKRIRLVHKRNHIHRDIKPDNFMTGRGENQNTIYIIDFGLAKKYYSESKNEHIKFTTGKSLVGTARYCGRNAHRGYEQGRRDDLESIGYMLVYFLKGKLPWQGIKIKRGEELYKKIGEIKEKTSFEQLTENCPNEFLLYFKNVDKLKFQDEPNYDYLTNLFNIMIDKYCKDFNYIYEFQEDVNLSTNTSTQKKKKYNFEQISLQANQADKPNENYDKKENDEYDKKLKEITHKDVEEDNQALKDKLYNGKINNMLKLKNNGVNKKREGELKQVVPKVFDDEIDEDENSFSSNDGQIFNIKNNKYESTPIKKLNSKVENIENEMNMNQPEDATFGDGPCTLKEKDPTKNYIDDKSKDDIKCLCNIF